MKPHEKSGGKRVLRQRWDGMPKDWDIDRGARRKAKSEPGQLELPAMPRPVNYPR